MAEKILENQVCQACGADVRLNALFCYNCGSAVTLGTKVETEANNGKTVSDVWVRESIVEENSSPTLITTELKAPKPIPIAKPDSLPDNFNKENVKPLSKTQINMKSAAELRQKAKLGQKKKIEISWGEPESTPNIWFLIAAFAITLFAVGILIAMLYIR